MEIFFLCNIFIILKDLNDCDSLHEGGISVTMDFSPIVFTIMQITLITRFLKSA